MPKVSASWKASLPISLLVTWPVMATIGMESMSASTRPVTRLVAPWSGGGAAHADAPCGTGIALGGEGRVLLMANEYVADRVVIQGVVERQGYAAGVSEDDVHTLPGQTFQKHLCATHQVRHAIPFQIQLANEREPYTTSRIYEEIPKEKRPPVGFVSPPVASVSKGGSLRRGR